MCIWLHRCSLITLPSHWCIRQKWNLPTFQKLILLVSVFYLGFLYSQSYYCTVDQHLLTANHFGLLLRVVHKFFVPYCRCTRGAGCIVKPTRQKEDKDTQVWEVGTAWTENLHSYREICYCRWPLLRKVLLNNGLGVHKRLVKQKCREDDSRI